MAKSQSSAEVGVEYFHPLIRNQCQNAVGHLNTSNFALPTILYQPMEYSAPVVPDECSILLGFVKGFMSLIYSLYLDSTHTICLHYNRQEDSL